MRKEMLGGYVDLKLKKRADSLAKKLGMSTTKLIERLVMYAIEIFEKEENEKKGEQQNERITT